MITPIMIEDLVVLGQIIIDGTPLEGFKAYTYLGQLGRHSFEEEVDRRIQLGWAAFRKLNHIFFNDG